MSSTSHLLRFSALAAVVSLAFNVGAQELSQRYTGVITDQHGMALEHVRVHIHGRQQYVYTDKQGRFSIQAPVNAELHISTPGYGDSFVTLTPQQTALDINLTKGGIERLVVSASGIHKNTLDMATPVSVLSGEKLSRRTESSIGETLKFEPGVHANYYGPVASSPIIRGLDGPRVRVLNNGLDTADVSRVGPDHAITADAITAEQIEVLRGPATLLYGSGAIGGVVNVVDNRIPRQLRASSETKLETRYTDVADEKMMALNHEGSNNNIAWHLDSFIRDTSDYAVPHFINDEGEHTTVLENSWLQTKAVNGGISYIGDKGLFGFSIGRLDSDYGIPGHHEDDVADSATSDAEAAVFAKLKQNRVSMAAEWYSPFAGIETVSVHGAYTDYQHQEIEGGETGTTFKNNALESRISLEHIALAGWHGLVGYHLQSSDYLAIGDEAFTPSSDSQSHALFVLEEKQFGNVSAQLGGRIELIRHEADASAMAFSAPLIRNRTDNFTALSGSAGVVWQFVPGFSWALAVSRSERAPSAAELYANGAHIATSSYELGLIYQLNNSELGLSEQKLVKETANNIDLTFRRFNGDLTFTYNIFYNKVHNYLYQANTGLTMADLSPESSVHDNFAVYQYQQQDATLYGLEFSARYQLNAAQSLQVLVDTVRATLDNGDYLPRIPPYKTGLEYQYQGLNWSADLGVTRYASQTHIAINETPTRGYTLLDASFNYDFSLAQLDMTAFIRGTNLSNELGFVHSSFIKEDAPLPGRAVTLGLRATF